MRRRAAVIAATLMSTLLLGACGNTSGQRYLVSGSPAPQDIQAFIPVAEQFVEQHRGLKFTKPVPVTFLSDSDFNAKLNAKNQTSGSDIEKAAKELEAMGLIQGHPDLAALETSLLNSSVVGFYDPKDKALYVRGTKLTPYTREVLVHELTHADQDQHFNIYHPELDQTNDERPEAWISLLEGDAVTVENEYVASESLADQQEALQEQAQAQAAMPSNIPQVLIELLTFPYIAGPPFVAALRQAGGQARLDAAFTHPPTTTQQILHPERFLAGDAGQTVAKPAADGKSFDDGILGEQGLDLLLGKAESDGNLDASTKDAASSDWDGDHYTAWDAPDGSSCIRIVFATRSPGDLNTLSGALQDYVQTLPNASVESSSPLTIKSCG